MAPKTFPSDANLSPVRGEPGALLRECAASLRLATHRRGRGPMAVFLLTGPIGGAAFLAWALRVLGWRTAVLPWRLTLNARRQYLATAVPDVVVMHGARHSLNRPALYPEWPIVYDIG